MEIISCLGTEKDRHGRHKHSDPCFEVRPRFEGETQYETEVSDLLSGGKIKVFDGDAVDAPEILLQRKFFRRMVKALRDREAIESDRSADGQFLQRLLVEVDAYSFVTPSIILAAPDVLIAEQQATNKTARERFDNVAARLVSYWAAVRRGQPQDVTTVSADICDILRAALLDA